MEGGVINRHPLWIIISVQVVAVVVVIVVVGFNILFFGGQDKVSDTSCGGVKSVTGDEYHKIEELTSWSMLLALQAELPHPISTLAYPNVVLFDSINDGG